ncbi:hypothetical protein U0070_020391 [Myodes glareolus]|uniref:Uncharacterized protein n=1 Tax=Myodes glareolus TaxID=447135 RepID=A0AAW0JYV7_MYOGA
MSIFEKYLSANRNDISKCTHVLKQTSGLGININTSDLAAPKPLDTTFFWRGNMMVLNPEVDMVAPVANIYDLVLDVFLRVEDLIILVQHELRYLVLVYHVNRHVSRLIFSSQKDEKGKFSEADTSTVTIAFAPILLWIIGCDVAMVKTLRMMSTKALAGAQVLIPGLARMLRDSLRPLVPRRSKSEPPTILKLLSVPIPKHRPQSLLGQYISRWIHAPTHEGQQSGCKLKVFPKGTDRPSVFTEVLHADSSVVLESVSDNDAHCREAATGVCQTKAFFITLGILVGILGACPEESATPSPSVVLGEGYKEYMPLDILPGGNEPDCLQMSSCDRHRDLCPGDSPTCISPDTEQPLLNREVELCRDFRRPSGTAGGEQARFQIFTENGQSPVTGLIMPLTTERNESRTVLSATAGPPLDFPFRAINGNNPTAYSELH